MELTTISFALNIVLGIAGWLLKNEHNNTKEDIKEVKAANKELKTEVDGIKDRYYKKEDFLEFKKELWARLDRIEEVKK